MKPCPTSRKKAFKSEAAALKSRRRLRATLRAYHCVCGYWHLTKELAR